MFESLSMSHPFIDGNERVAFFGTDVFLRLMVGPSPSSPMPRMHS
jgi:hypothetical protein